MTPATDGERWAELLADFERRGPTQAERDAFGFACHQTSHLPVGRRIRAVRVAVKLDQPPVTGCAIGEGVG